MYHRFIANGGHTCISLNEVVAILKQGKWQIHDTPIGKLYSEYCAVDEVAEVLGSVANVSGIKPRRNNYASEFFGIEVCGECYLHATPEVNWRVVTSVCIFERERKTLAHQGILKATAPFGENAPNGKWSGNR
jgi:hypothetical protein